MLEGNNRYNNKHPIKERKREKTIFEQKSVTLKQLNLNCNKKDTNIHMVKKGTKRKTRWRTLSIGDGGATDDAASDTGKTEHHNYNRSGERGGTYI